MVERRSPKPDVVGSSPTWPGSSESPRDVASVRSVKAKGVQGATMKKIIQFFKDSYAELSKVVWPSKDDVIASTKIVVVSTVAVALVLGLIDFLIVLGIEVIFR
jgi:preprotein translocase subunit SecE